MIPPRLDKICIVCHREFPRDYLECPDDRVRLTEKDERIGTIFDGKYEIVDFIGAGGLSRVYKARHLELNRTMALKVLKSSELIDLQRFRREAISIGKLEHPNIARVFSFAVAPNGCPYMALEFLDGRDLAEWLVKDGPLNLRQAVNVFEQVASALEHAHSRNIIHRDIKPGNILILSIPEQADLVKVVDFGMARFQLEGGVISQKLTQEGEIFGTRQYISPEQYRGIVADQRADIYSLGVTMYEAVLKDGKIPEVLRPVISKATETDPTQRYQTAEELRAELSNIKTSLNSEDQRPSSGYVEAIPTATTHNTSGRDFFGTFYFWTMLSGMAVLAICATVVVKQRIAALEVISCHSQKSALGRVAALSLAATQNQAEVLVNKGQAPEAIRLYEDWLHRNRNSEKWSAQCVAEQQMSRIYAMEGDFDAAQKCAEQGLSIADKHGIKAGCEYEDLLLTTAAILTSRKDYKRSMAISAEIMDITQDMEFNHELDARLISFNNISQCQAGLGQMDEAERTATEGLELAERSYGVHSSAYADACQQLASIADVRKQYAKALVYIDKAVTALRKSGARYNEPQLLATAYKASLETSADDAQSALADYTYVSNEFLKSPHIHTQIERELKQHMRKVANYLGKKADIAKWQ